MNLKKIYGNAERFETLTEDVKMYSVNTSATTTCKKGSMMPAVYDFGMQITSSQVYSREELVNVKNAIKVMFVKYGEQCLDEKFLTERLKSEYPELNILGVSLEYVYKYFKDITVRLNAGSEWMSADILLFDSEKTDTDNASV